MPLLASIHDGTLHAYPDVAALLEKRLHGVRGGFRHHVLLTGPLGIGKTTTVLGALAAADPELLIVYCESRREPWDLWCRRFLTAILHGLVGFRSAPEIGQLTPHELLPKVTAQAPHTAQTIAQLLRGSGGPHERVFRQLLELPGAACAETGRPGVVILDEFQQLESVRLSRPFHELGKRIMLDPSLLYILTSSTPLHAQRIVHEQLNLLFGGFETVTLRGMDPATAQAWVRARLPSPLLASSVVPFLAHVAAGHPWLLDTITQALAAQPTADQMIQCLAHQLADARSPLADWCASRLRVVEQARTRGAYLALLTTLSGHRSPVRPLARATQQTLAETSRQLSRLVEWELVGRHGDLYVIDNPLWNFWFQHIFQVQRRAPFTTVQAMALWTAPHLQAAWQHFALHTTHPPMDRFLHLLRQFQNETVSVECRRVRLPRFNHLESTRLGDDMHCITAQPPSGRPWLYCVKASRLQEGDVARAIAWTRPQAPRVSRRVVVGLDDCDPAALLLAKASRLWVWHRPILHNLFQLYRCPPLSL